MWIPQIHVELDLVLLYPSETQEGFLKPSEVGHACLPPLWVSEWPLVVSWLQVEAWSPRDLFSGPLPADTDHTCDIHPFNR